MQTLNDVVRENKYSYINKREIQNYCHNINLLFTMNHHNNS